MKRKLAKILVILFALVAFWFLGIDGSWFVEDCPDCLHGRDVFQIRIFTVPIYEQVKEDHSVLEKITEDLGVTCRHPNLVRWHKHRYWGLLICAYPCINGIYRLTGDDRWYDDKARAIVKEMAKTAPALRGNFSTRVLKNHDWKYLKAFVQQVATLRDDRQAAATSQLLEVQRVSNNLTEPEVATGSGRGENRIQLPAIVSTNPPAAQQ